MCQKCSKRERRVYRVEEITTLQMLPHVIVRDTSRREAVNIMRGMWSQLRGSPCLVGIRVVHGPAGVVTDTLGDAIGLTMPIGNG